jgi:hypothetical protein
VLSPITNSPTDVECVEQLYRLLMHPEFSLQKQGLALWEAIGCESVMDLLIEPWRKSAYPNRIGTKVEIGRTPRLITPALLQVLLSHPNWPRRDRLTLTNGRGCHDLTWLRSAPHLRSLRIHRLHPEFHLGSIRELAHLTRLELSQRRQSLSLEPLRYHPTLTALALRAIPVESFQPINTCLQLRSLELDFRATPVPFEALTSLQNLQTLRVVSHDQAPVDLQPLLQLQNLKRLNLVHLAGLTDSATLRELEAKLDFIALPNDIESSPTPKSCTPLPSPQLALPLMGTTKDHSGHPLRRNHERTP